MTDTNEIAAIDITPGTKFLHPSHDFFFVKRDLDEFVVIADRYEDGHLWYREQGHTALYGLSVEYVTLAE